VIVLVGCCMTALLGVGALVIDIGHKNYVGARAQSAADAAALAGAVYLPDDPATARSTALTLAANRPSHTSRSGEGKGSSRASSW
jgi:Flp pilus assembly protein TadG